MNAFPPTTPGCKIVIAKFEGVDRMVSILHGMGIAPVRDLVHYTLADDSRP